MAYALGDFEHTPPNRIGAALLRCDGTHGTRAAPLAWRGTVAGSPCARYGKRGARFSLCRSPTRSGRYATATRKKDIARSTAIVVLFPSNSSSQRACANDSGESRTSDSFPVEGAIHLIIRTDTTPRLEPLHGPPLLERRSTQEPLDGRKDCNAPFQIA